jgi:dienelactone hydrolase
MKKSNIFILICALAAISSSILVLHCEREGVTTAQSWLGDIPITRFQPATGGPAPIVIIAHGFAGSQQLMQPMAVTLARNGYTAVTFDFAGHGRNPLPLSGGIRDMDESARLLLSEIDDVVRFASTLPGAGSGVALVGHSMAADLVVRYAIDHPEISAVVAISVFGSGITATEPKSLLVVDGAWEPKFLTDAGFRIVGMVSKGPAKERTTYGDPMLGTGRRFVLAEGAEHIGVIYSRDALTETLIWTNAVFGRTSSGFIDRRGKWLALLFLGLVALALPLSRFLPVMSSTPLGAGLRWRKLVPIAIAPAVLTPLLLWKAPTDFLPILLGDYLVIHFALYGLLTAGGLWAATRGSTPIPRPSGRTGWLVAAAIPVSAFYVVGLGSPIDAFVTSFMPTSSRWLIFPVMFCGLALYFLADEWLTRGIGAAKGAYVATKICFLVSLSVAVALNPAKLFFLMIIVPVICIFFIIHGLISRWTYARTRDPRVAALGNAAGLAWAISVTFPIVG